jgi:hypothetical protein
MLSGPVPRILAAQTPEGYWEKPGPGYATKYHGTVWQLIFLADLGADGRDPRVARACDYVLSHSQTENGGFGASGREENRPPPSSALHCLNGNLLRACIVLGWLDDERVQKSMAWEADAITGENGSFRYYQSTTAGPGFACGINYGQPCAWGALKALRALLAIPPDRRSSMVERALEVGRSFLLSRDPAVADYPYSNRVSPNWFRFGFLPSYWSDVLETVEVLAGLGLGSNPRLQNAVALIEGKADASGRWQLEKSLNGRTWARVEAAGKPSKWITLRALRTLKLAGRDVH